ncbi:ABC transporter ATP-binding protein [uncultured Ruminococcus sp.]|uniref:ABC transporter ATP-binding protein n=1 Tax=uncultured Ruminococcus sp. TaxID=165186 RepID=UPI0025DC338F|nr:ABC transporter ATP-binding protein [uncultured Ruminococcus sp.]
MSAIVTKNLTKKYKDKIAVNSINLSINDGEMYALLGVNGAGKSTTIKMLSCLIKPTSGDALLNGNSIVSDSEKVKRIINVSPQETAVAPNLTVRENLELMARIYGFGNEDAVSKAQKMIEDFELSDISKSKAKTLSGGWQRRLSIAMALISDPEILFLDEPTLGLDVLARRELWNKIGSLKGKITIILTTHYLEEAESLSDRIGIMVKGNLIAEGTAEGLKQSVNANTFEDAFVKIAEEGK